MKKGSYLVESHLIDETTKEIINSFIKSMELKCRSKSTIYKYKGIAEKYFIFIQKPLEELTKEDTHKWLTECHSDKKPRTVDLYLSAMSSFFKYCEKEEYIERKLIKKKWYPKIPQSVPRYLTDSEVAKVKIQLEKQPIKYRALLELLLSSGCRASEASNIDINNIDFENRTIQIIGKGGKRRAVIFSQEASLLLKTYLETRKDDNPALFLNKFGSRLTNQGIYYIVKKMGKIAELSMDFTPHRSRHTFATQMLSGGAPLTLIKMFLGHKDYRATKVYTSVLSEDLIAKYEQILGYM